MYRLLLITFLLPLGALGQTLVLEEIPIPAAESANIEAEIGGVPTTYRLSLILPTDYEIQIVYGDFTGTLAIQSTGTFYQNPFGGAAAQFVDPDQYLVSPELVYDSWITLGDDDVVGNASEIYPSEVPFADWEAGGDLMINDIIGAGVFLGTTEGTEQSTGGDDHTVLLGQFTCNGDVFGQVNFQLRRLNPDGSIYDPPGTETSETEVYLEQSFTSVDAGAGCAADLDGNGEIRTGDLLVLIADYGCNVFPCPGDLNNNGLTETGDILILLSVYGQDCP